jgi:hypothetical protein
MRLALFACLILLTSSCRTQLAPFGLSFGSGGGFTGATTMHSLSPDGKISRYESISKKTSEAGKISIKEVKKILTLIQTQKLTDLHVNTPSNMSNYLNMTINGIESKQTWATGTTSGSPALDSLFNRLNSLVTK